VINSIALTSHYRVHFIELFRHIILRLLMLLIRAVLLVAVNIYSSRLAARIQIICTVSKLLALAIVIVGGLVKLAQGKRSTLLFYGHREMYFNIHECLDLRIAQKVRRSEGATVVEWNNIFSLFPSFL